MNVSTNKQQLAIAKQRGLPLIVIGYDDRHLTKEQGGKVGSMTSAGPVAPEVAAEFLEFLYAFLRRKAGVAQQQPTEAELDDWRNGDSADFERATP